MNIELLDKVARWLEAGAPEAEMRGCLPSFTTRRLTQCFASDSRTKTKARQRACEPKT